jgi:hypothetical protein
MAVGFEVGRLVGDGVLAAQFVLNFGKGVALVMICGFTVHF